MTQTPVRKLAVLLHADVVGSTSLVQENETLAHERILDTFQRFSEAISNYGGIAGEIRVALESENFNQAHSLIHNLKGLAGNLEAISLQTAAVKMEKLVKGDQTQTPSSDQLDQKFTELEKAINRALKSVQTLGTAAAEAPVKSTTEWSANVPDEQLKEIADRINAAAEMGDVIQIQSIAEELKSEFDEAAPFCDELIRLADDFDFDGIQRCVDELDN